MVNKCEVMGRQTLNEKKKTSNYAGENESRVITANEVTLPRVHPQPVRIPLHVHCSPSQCSRFYASHFAGIRRAGSLGRVSRGNEVRAKKSSWIEEAIDPGPPTFAEGAVNAKVGRKRTGTRATLTRLAEPGSRIELRNIFERFMLSACLGLTKPRPAKSKSLKIQLLSSPFR